MIRQTDIPPVSPGEALSVSLLNRIIAGANSARVVTGDGDIEVNTTGGLMGIALSQGRKADRNVEVLVMPGRLDASSKPLPGGMYKGKMYLQSIIGLRDTPGIVEKPDPSPNEQTCWVMNTDEFGHDTHQIVSFTATLGRIVGVFRGAPLVWVNVRRAGLDIAIVKANGTDGVNPKYDLYELGDTDFVTKINSAALSPTCSRARVQTTVPVAAAPNGSVATIYRDALGAIKLFDLPETLGGRTCSTP